MLPGFPSHVRVFAVTLFGNCNPLLHVNVNVVPRDLLEFGGSFVALVNGSGSGQLSSARYDIGFGTTIKKHFAIISQAIK